MKAFKLFSKAMLAALALSPAVASAQSTSFYKTPYKSRNSGSFHKGDNIVSFGIGFPNISMNNIYSNGSYSWGLPPMYGKYEYGIMDELSIGGRIGMGTGRYKYMNVRANNFGMSMSVVGYYHFNKLIPVSRLDVYAGAGLGSIYRSYETISGPNTVYRDNDFSIRPVFLVGARWYFTQTFGVYGESGYDGLSVMNLGISLRF